MNRTSLRAVRGAAERKQQAHEEEKERNGKKLQAGCGGVLASHNLVSL